MAIIQQASSHTVWECKYHIVWIPKYRKKKLYKDLRQYLGETLRELAMQKECKIEEGHLMSDHVHMWKAIKGIRDVLSHHYFDLNAEAIYNACTDDSDRLHQTILKMLKEV